MHLTHIFYPIRLVLHLHLKHIVNPGIPTENFNPHTKEVSAFVVAPSSQITLIKAWQKS